MIRVIQNTSPISDELIIERIHHMGWTDGIMLLKALTNKGTEGWGFLRWDYVDDDAQLCRFTNVKVEIVGSTPRKRKLNTNDKIMLTDAYAVHVRHCYQGGKCLSSRWHVHTQGIGRGNCRWKGWKHFYLMQNISARKPNHYFDQCWSMRNRPIEMSEKAKELELQAYLHADTEMEEHFMDELEALY